MSEMNLSENEQFYRYDGIRNKKMRFPKPIARLIVYNSYNLKIQLRKTPVIGVFLYNCHNVTVDIDSGSNSTLECTRCHNTKFATDDTVDHIAITEYECKNVTVNGYRIDGVWVSSEWELPEIPSGNVV